MKYKCSICGTEYDNITDYAECVSKCVAEQKHNEERLRKETLAKEKQSRFKEVRDAEKTFYDLKEKYVNDYGCYMSGCSDDWANLFTPIWGEIKF